jgi:hypothetical protein
VCVCCNQFDQSVGRLVSSASSFVFIALSCEYVRERERENAPSNTQHKNRVTSVNFSDGWMNGTRICFALVESVATRPDRQSGEIIQQMSGSLTNLQTVAPTKANAMQSINQSTKAMLYIIQHSSSYPQTRFIEFNHQLWLAHLHFVVWNERADVDTLPKDSCNNEHPSLLAAIAARAPDTYHLTKNINCKSLPACSCRRTPRIRST